MNPANDPKVDFVVVDASVVVAMVAWEHGNNRARRVLSLYSESKAQFFAPSVIISETLLALCRKLQEGVINVKQHSQALLEFRDFLNATSPSPSGDFALMERAEAIRYGYTCRRTTDSIYLALAEELSQTGTTVLLTFDDEIKKQAARNAPTVRVRVLKRN